MFRTTLRSLPLVFACASIPVFMLNPKDVEACSIAGNQPFVIQGEADANSEPLPPPSVGESSVFRGTQQALGFVNTCSDVNYVTVSVYPPEGYLPEEVGYRVDFLEGDIPDGFRLSEEVVHGREGFLLFDFSKKAGDQPIDAKFALIAVDVEGRESEPVPFELVDLPPFDDGLGCQSVPLHNFSLLMLLGGLLLFGNRRHDKRLVGE